MKGSKQCFWAYTDNSKPRYGTLDNDNIKNLYKYKNIDIGTKKKAIITLSPERHPSASQSTAFWRTQQHTDNNLAIYTACKQQQY
jgi:hypothetical protein